MVKGILPRTLDGLPATVNYQPPQPGSKPGFSETVQALRGFAGLLKKLVADPPLHITESSYRISTFEQALQDVVTCFDFGLIVPNRIFFIDDPKRYKFQTDACENPLKLWKELETKPNVVEFVGHFHHMRTHNRYTRCQELHVQLEGHPYRKVRDRYEISFGVYYLAREFMGHSGRPLSHERRYVEDWVGYCIRTARRRMEKDYVRPMAKFAGKTSRMMDRIEKHSKKAEVKAEEDAKKADKKVAKKV